jgi:endonuclease/exonuclease/phosphatase (EEP) superfamily protein YafD
VAAALILTAVLALPVAARLSGNRSSTGIALAALAPVAAVAAVAIAIVAIVLLGPIGVLPAVPAAVLAGWQVLPRGRRIRRRPVPTRPEAAAAAGFDVLRVVTFNALVGRAEPGAILNQLRRLAPDVLVVEELTPELADILTASLASALPYASLDPAPGWSGLGIWSRRPLRQLSPVPETCTPMPRVELDLAGGRPLTVTLVHPLAPRNGGHRAWHHDFGLLLSAVSETAGPQLVVGDFNASRDHRQFRRLLDAGLADCADIAQRRSWPGFTWPANRWFPALMRLDHVLVSHPGATAREVRTLQVPGTDHRGVLAVVELHPSSGSSVTAPERATAGRLT